ncbi:MAG TPA: hypothetical protein VG929_06340 [Actinomycetota bacterium]|nr:hypothetical protein [Actinomycetota bacterium]
MSNPRLQRFTSWVTAVVLAFSLSAITGACVVETDEDDDVEQVETDEEEGTEVETEVEVEDEETP